QAHRELTSALLADVRDEVDMRLCNAANGCRQKTVKADDSYGARRPDVASDVAAVGARVNQCVLIIGDRYCAHRRSQEGHLTHQKHSPECIASVLELPHPERQA